MNIRPLSPELQKIAIDELSEDPGRIEKDLQAFREWITKSRHISSRPDDQFLIAFLRGCKYRMEIVKQKFDLYHTLKTHLPESTRNRDPLDEKVRGAIRQGMCIPLPKPTPDSPYYVIFRPGALDISKNTSSDFSKILTMWLDLMMVEDDNIVIAGHVLIKDFTGFTVSHLAHYTPGFGRRGTALLQDGSPMRQKSSNFVNLPSFALSLFETISSFVNEENKLSVFVHGSNMESLYKMVPREIFPAEYGGKAGTIQELIDKFEKLLVANREFFLKDEEYGVDEKKRVGVRENAESLFGIDGSFRQLKVD